MTSLPLHPALVHIPLGLAFVIPALAAVFAAVLWFQFWRRAGGGSLVRPDEMVRVNWRTPGPRSWIAIVALQAVLFGAGLVAMNTGEREEERVESIVPESAIERHEEFAQQFVWGAGATLLLGGLVLVFRRPAAALALVTATAVASLIVAGLAIRVGRAGGELVYTYNAGAAYSSAPRTANATAESSPARRMDARPSGAEEGRERAEQRRRY